MGFRDLFKNKKEETSSVESTASLGEVYEIIDTLWGEKRVKQIVHSLKREIDSLVYQKGVNRKTDLLLYGIDLSLNFFYRGRKENSGSMAGDNLTAFIFFRNFLECVLAMDDDIMDISEFYIIFQITKGLPSDVHPYIQMMIKTYDLLDRGIIYIYENINGISKDYFPIVANKIKAFLNEYVDDRTAWNKVVKAK